MNKQFRVVDGEIVPKGIEWTLFRDPATNKRRAGYTTNPIAGCLHGCRWQMPDGTIAECYAETTAEHSLAKSAYPQGFAHHYWKPDHLDEPRRLKEPAGIFVGSMSDIFGHWVPRDQIEAVLKMIRDCPQHILYTLTKNPRRMLEFPGQFASNHLVGASMPPTHFMKKRLTPNQQIAMFRHTLANMIEFRAKNPGIKTWISFEPVAVDVADLVEEFGAPLDWAVIGAASRGSQYFQPDPDIVTRLHDVLRKYGIPVFHKGNLRWDTHLEEFPAMTINS